MSDYLFELLIASTAGVSILILLLLLLRPALHKYLNAKVIYTLWLSIPIFLVISIVWNEFLIVESSMIFLPSMQSTLSPMQFASKSVDKVSAQILLAVWLIGMLIAILKYVIQYRRLILSSTQVSEPIAYMPEDFQSVSSLKVVNTPLVDAPAVFGFINAYLILPKAFESLPENKRQLILEHEFFHLRRRDFQVNVMRHLLKSVFWFNPLIYLADKYIEADQEISCDLGVLQNYGSQERKNYAQALLESISGYERNELLSQWKFQSLVKERIKMLKKKEQKKWHGLVAGIFAATCVWFTSGIVLADKNSGQDAVPLEIIEPRYPREAAVNGVEGWVKFEFSVDSNGQPYEIAIVGSEPELTFRPEALKALKQWRFKPGTGKQKLFYTMEFKLE